MATQYNLKLTHTLQTLPQRAEFLRQLMASRSYVTGEARHISWVSVTADRESALLELPGVLCIERDTGCDQCTPFVCPVDVNTPWHLDMINAQEAHTVSYGAGKKIAVIDTGIAMQKDLVDSRISVIETFVPKESAVDIQGHGTAIAGILVGQGDIVHGIAPKAEVFALKALDSRGRGRWSWIALAIERAGELRADVGVMALGGGDGSLMVEDALTYATEQGTLFVTASGNTGAPFLDYPGSSSKVITVAAVDCSGRRPHWSNWAPWDKGPDIAAPGVNIPSLSIKGNQQYKTLSGTSMATAVAGGILALGNLPKNFAKARQKIHESTISIPVSREKGGYGLLNAALLVGAVQVR